eukprot:7356932-Prymnesium_polylepis.1
MSQGRGPGQYVNFAIRTDLPANARGFLRGGVTVLTPPRVRYVSIQCPPKPVACVRPCLGVWVTLAL